MVFLFNFIVSPSRHLDSLYKQNKNIKILTAGSKFFLEIGAQDRYERVRCIPRMQLNSPIDSKVYDLPKTKSDRVRIGMHSKGARGKWNSEWPKLIEMCNERMKDKIWFDFMGMNKDVGKKIALLCKDADNVTLRKEDSVSVAEYLTGLDIFCFFPDFKREEPWARCTAEAMISGCPLIATPKGGNVDQVVIGNNGFLCSDTRAFFQRLVYLVEHQDEMAKMSENAKLIARDFSTQKVIEKFMDYIK
jgi:glycosyltransferase involved in cell wall biosynthesis